MGPTFMEEVHVVTHFYRALTQKYKNRKMNYWCWSLDRVPSAAVAEMSQERMKKQLEYFSASMGECGRDAPSATDGKATASCSSLRHVEGF